MSHNVDQIYQTGNQLKVHICIKLSAQYPLVDNSIDIS